MVHCHKKEGSGKVTVSSPKCTLRLNYIMAQISEGGEDSKGLSYFFKLWDLNVIRNDLICMLGLLPQFNDTNASMDLEQN